jgi:Arc/MetJ-type ribon-helix-helix transcriptional regulator
MRRRLTNRAVGYKGETVPVTVRLSKPICDFIDAHLGQPDMRTRSDALQDAAALWALREERDG